MKQHIRRMKEEMADILDLPREVMLNLPKISVIGRGQMFIENHKGMIEYSPDRIRINTTCGAVRIGGCGLTVKNIGAEDMLISGDIEILEYL